MLIRFALLASLLALTACSTMQPPPPAAGVLETPAAVDNNQQLEFKLASGTYRCDMGQRVDVQRTGGNANQIQIGWSGKRYQLARNPSHSGLPRFEDDRSGLVWIDLPWKSILLDRDTNKPLASDCKLG
ncbi:MliC family protein [Aromatoleum toluclasticum]|uniref:MliC family protein n=1 Tax=Aromatoleum toluclasticum TaxID=92003 RepID=UPI00037A7D25|nr:MliC family protein [Aromatoleum toluclasticum]MCC4116790.1 MliC family protein [Aromatoleum toluclasticum]